MWRSKLASLLIHGLVHREFHSRQITLPAWSTPVAATGGALGVSQVETTSPEAGAPTAIVSQWLAEEVREIGDKEAAFCDARSRTAARGTERAFDRTLAERGVGDENGHRGADVMDQERGMASDVHGDSRIRLANRNRSDGTSSSSSRPSASTTAC